ncbi:MAG: YdeI/OmpD-associated family protein [Dyadobacter sp.]|uniref:YdeI/OmpD-associated family protein n=1 Tax=Dyadobacter sp. TaxID=1914288 RepID=UPI001B21E5F5|nr:YdeI/OmpD-associated family protein [Dyadobacter sp.]MBO9614193.1 YdeI/OmpD-associated family protein [Dyadobacter sp.]
MSRTDPRIDAYIVKSASFAIPILEYLRALVHETCPDAKETMKWSFPHFEYKGSILCSMASFKQHCSFGFWLESRLSDPDNLLAVNGERVGMGSLGKITGIEDLPAEEHLRGFILEAMRLIDSGVKLKKENKPQEPKELVVPAYVTEALADHAAAKKVFEGFSYSNKKEYVEWFEDAKTEATREKRIAQALEWLAEGKVRNWKYVR